MEEKTGSQIVDAIRRKVDREGALHCASAFKIAEEAGVMPLRVGETADTLGIKLNRCQLGLFGYGPKVEGLHKIVEPAETVGEDLAQAIRDRLEDGRLTCRAAWDVAAALRIPKMDVSAAAETLGIKIVRCQIGAF
ncbi:MAG: hypothetical protein JXD18_11270 [Anaerolineae bacterium]|nr:hypothetical protein [Anaerolineae bacterium]